MAKQMFRALVALLLTLPVWLYAAPRVITLSPANTELAFAAGITPVGVSSYSDYPPEATKIEQVSNLAGNESGTHCGAEAGSGRRLARR